MKTSSPHLLLLDIGNTHTHAGLCRGKRIYRQKDFRTPGWKTHETGLALERYVAQQKLSALVFCSVVPDVNETVTAWGKGLGLEVLQLGPGNVHGIGIDYPKPATIGQDRLANASAAFHRFGGPVVVVDFGTAVTFDVVNRQGNYVGGILAPGLAAMTDYLHEKTALLPRIKIRETRRVIGKNTKEAMLIGAVHGYRGLIRQLLMELKLELKSKRLPVIATGGYAALMASGMPEIDVVDSTITLEGLRLAWKGKDYGE